MYNIAGQFIFICAARLTHRSLTSFVVRLLKAAPVMLVVITLCFPQWSRSIHRNLAVRCSSQLAILIGGVLLKDTHFHIQPPGGPTRGRSEVSSHREV